jgi:hypothetical protein
MGWFLFFIVLFLVAYPPVDDTDKSFWSRSGLTLYTDQKTGLQYLANNGFFAKGGLIPRLDENGKHMKR